MANGATLGKDGMIYMCEQGNKIQPSRISRIDPKSLIRTVILEEWHSTQFNSPNDIVMRKTDNSIWFTDPVYGFVQVSIKRINFLFLIQFN